MKFRALMIENTAMREFMSITISLSKFSKHCVMRITADKLYFIISEEDGGPRRPLVWCELPIKFYFKEYNVVGVNQTHNEIYLELPTALLAGSCSILKQDVKSFKIKLTNKESPCITLETELGGGDILTRQCVHDIPVEVISKKHWSDYEEPRFSDFHVSIDMPNLKSVKNIVERMRNMSHSLTVSANKNGKITLEINTNIVKLAAHFPDLSVQSFIVDDISSGHSNDINPTENHTISSTVDIKKFLMFLSGMQITNCKANCNIIHGKMVKLFMEQPGALSFQIFLTELSI